MRQPVSVRRARKSCQSCPQLFHLSLPDRTILVRQILAFPVDDFNGKTLETRLFADEQDNYYSLDELRISGQTHRVMIRKMASSEVLRWLCEQWVTVPEERAKICRVLASTR